MLQLSELDSTSSWCLLVSYTTLADFGINNAIIIAIVNSYNTEN
jgi:hypothetical protein